MPKRLNRYLKDLAAPEPAKRRAAAEALGCADERALYALIRALSDESPGVQDAAMRSLIAIGGEVTAYMVLPLLREGSYLRNTAAVILREIGRPAVPLLGGLLKDKDDDVRKFALDLLGDIGVCDHTGDIVGMLGGDPNPNVRASAARVLGLFRHAGALPELIRALTDDEWVSFSALEALAAIGDDRASIALESALGSSSEAIRHGALEALGRITSPLASTALMAHLEKAEGIEKRMTLKSLVRAGVTPHMSEVSGMLVEMLRDGDGDDLCVAAAGLAGLRDEGTLRHIADAAGSIDPADPAGEECLAALKGALASFGCTEALTNLLGDPSVRHRGRSAVAEVLGTLKCEDAVPALEGLMKSAETGVRRAAAAALSAIESPLAREALTAALSDEDGHVRAAAVAALGRSRDRGAFRLIRERLESERYADVVEESVRALVSIDEAAFAAGLGGIRGAVRESAGRWLTDAEALLELSQDRDPGVRASALAGLGRNRAASARGRLIEALGDPDAEVRRAAVTSLGEIGCCAEHILRALGDGDLWVRVAAVRAVGILGDRSLAERLEGFSSEPAVPLALAALEALALICGSDGVGAFERFAGHPDRAVQRRVSELAGQS